MTDSTFGHGAGDPLDALRLPVVPVQPRPSFAADLLQRLRSGPEPGIERSPLASDTATVRYFIDDLDAAVTFYLQLGFEIELRSSPAFAMLYRGNLRLLLSTPASHRLVDGTMPEPGGWNRISLRFDDLDQAVGALRERCVRFRVSPTSGAAARIAVMEDPAGNLIEMFEPQAAYHERRGDTP